MASPPAGQRSPKRPAPKATVPPERGTHRVEGFSDAFFAIVITLLIIELRPVRSAGGEIEPLLHSLRELWPVGLAYIISFINIYILWVSHHELMRITTRADTSFLYLNGALLLGIGVMPFSTSLLADHINGEDAKLAAAIYAGAFLWVALGFNLLWRYLMAHPDRLLATVSKRDRRRIGRTYLVALLLYSAAVALAWIEPWASVAITLVLAVFFAVADRLSGFASEDVADEPSG